MNTKSINKTLRSIVNPFVLALGLGCLMMSPVIAQADQKPAQEQRDQKAKPNFPMKAEDFRKMVNERLSKMQARFDKMLSKKNPPAEKKEQMKKAFDAGIAKIKAAVDKAAADSTVTQEEAKEVRQVVKAQRKELRAHHGKGKGKGKGKREDNVGGARRDKRV